MQGIAFRFGRQGCRSVGVWVAELCASRRCVRFRVLETALEHLLAVGWSRQVRPEECHKSRFQQSPFTKCPVLFVALFCPEVAEAKTFASVAAD